MLQYLRDRSRYQEKDSGLPNSNNSYRKAFSTPVPIHLQLPATEKETSEPLPTDGGLPKGGGLPDIKILPQNGGLPGNQKDIKKKRKHLKRVKDIKVNMVNADGNRVNADGEEAKLDDE
jgi:hypothetical protein